MKLLLKCLLIVIAMGPFAANAQVQVLGVEIGSTTQQQLRAALRKRTDITDNGINKYSEGPQITTSGAGYGIDGLSGVSYVFDKDQRLAAVGMEISKGRFDDVFKLLAEKYKVTAQERPFVGNMFGRFKGKGFTIELDAPHMGFVMLATYFRDDIYEKIKAQSAQEAQEKKASEKNKF